MDIHAYIYTTLASNPDPCTTCRQLLDKPLIIIIIYQVTPRTVAQVFRLNSRINLVQTNSGKILDIHPGTGGDKLEVKGVDYVGCEHLDSFYVHLPNLGTKHSTISRNLP